LFFIVESEVCREFTFFVITYRNHQNNFMNIDFTTQGTCSKRIEAEVENGIVKEVRFTGGCNGNLQGICALVKGMPVDEVIRKLEGIRCGSRPTSCPDQLCRALRSLQV
jgi:uncharacterized protein (TIGR03905 family)